MAAILLGYHMQCTSSSALSRSAKIHADTRLKNILTFDIETVVARIHEIPMNDHTASICLCLAQHFNNHYNSGRVAKTSLRSSSISERSPQRLRDTK